MKKAFVVIWLSILLIPACAPSGKVKTSKVSNPYRGLLEPLPDELFVPNPENPVTPEKVKLGKLLYFDNRLSLSGAISCNTCHNLFQGGVDNRPTSLGHRWNKGPRNAPTVYNAALHFAQFWDGRAKDVEEQAGMPILNPIEMASTREIVIQRLKNTPGYVELFKKAFSEEPDPVRYENVGKAIGAFERTLLTPSRVDRYLRGDENALSQIEKEGMELFVTKGCASCHNGPGIGGGIFAHFEFDSDTGRYEVTHKEEDKYMFKVPGLRNVELTYPYFHSGKVWKLEEAVRIMARKQLGLKLTDDETEKIVAFLKALTGLVPEVKVEFAPPSIILNPAPSE